MDARSLLPLLQGYQLGFLGNVHALAVYPHGQRVRLDAQGLAGKDSHFLEGDGLNRRKQP